METRGNPELWEIKSTWLIVSWRTDVMGECVMSVGYCWPCWMLPYSKREKNLKRSIVPVSFHCHPKVWATFVLNVLVYRRVSVIPFTKWLVYRKNKNPPASCSHFDCLSRISIMQYNFEKNVIIKSHKVPNRQNLRTSIFHQYYMKGTIP
jgi:hypothetical protein